MGPRRAFVVIDVFRDVVEHDECVEFLFHNLFGCIFLCHDFEILLFALGLVFRREEVI